MMDPTDFPVETTTVGFVFPELWIAALYMLVAALVGFQIGKWWKVRQLAKERKMRIEKIYDPPLRKQLGKRQLQQTMAYLNAASDLTKEMRKHLGGVAAFGGPFGKHFKAIEDAIKGAEGASGVASSQSPASGSGSTSVQTKVSINIAGQQTGER